MKRMMLVLLILLMLVTTSCAGNNSALQGEIEKDFTNAMNAYQEIWKTKDISQASILAKNAFTNDEIINQVLESYKARIEIDQGINITDKKYNITLLNYDQNKATLKVEAYLKGYPISIMSGYKKITKKQDFSFGPHSFEMRKEQGKWKISKF